MNINDIHYDWPIDILHYETRYFLGLSLMELMIIALPAVGVALLLQKMLGLFSIVLGAILAVAIFFCVRRWAGLGDQTLIAYAFFSLKTLMRNEIVSLPIIYPATGMDEIRIEDLDGNLVTTITKID